MAIIISYDVDAKHVELKKLLLEMGYQDRLTGYGCKETGGLWYFPNTTFYHQTKSTAQARDDVRSLCQQLRISLLRCVASTWGDPNGDCGQPHS